MALIEWSDSLETRIPEIDEQHRNLVDIANDLDEAVRHGRDKRVMAETLDRLITYTQEHFTSEEILMEKHAYGQLPLHRVQHRQLLEKVMNFRRQHNVAEQRITGKVTDFLRYWLCSHIMKDDMQFGEVMAREPSQ